VIRILLACEGGSGLGHVTNLKTIATALGPAFSFDGTHHQEKPLDVLEPHCDAVFRCPALWVEPGRASVGANETNWCWGNFIESCGFARTLFLSDALAWWRATMLNREIDLVVCNFAPRAQLAARTLGIPVVLTGTGYSVPPDGLQQFPAFLDRNAATAVDGRAIMDAVNAICVIRGMPALQHLPDFCDADVKLPFCIDLFDPYGDLRNQPLLTRPSAFSQGLAGNGDEIFVYLSNVVADPLFLLEALADLGAPVRVHAPWPQPDKLAALVASGAIIEDKPVDPDTIAARSRMMVHYGQPSTTSMALAAALPQLALPQHFEQLVHARLAEKTGAVQVIPRRELTRDRFIAEARRVYTDESITQAARRIAPRVRQQMAIDLPDMIRESLRPVLVEIVKRKGLA
jgi:hypothetical protein